MNGHSGQEGGGLEMYVLNGKGLAGGSMGKYHFIVTMFKERA